MTTMMEQFLQECRELLERAGAGLLALEKSPGDGEVLDELFRSMHTMKGASGLFDIQPFTAVVHAAEDTLDAVRDGRAQIEPETIDVLLAALDQIGRWLDDLEARGALGQGAREAGQELSDRLRRLLDAATGAGAVMAEGPGGGADAAANGTHGQDAAPDWLAALPASTRGALARECADGQPLCCLEYVPHTHVFFSGDDPLFTVLQLPGLRWLGIEPVRPWPPLDELDPFACALRFRAMLACDPGAAAHDLRYVDDQIVLSLLREPRALDGPGEEAGSAGRPAPDADERRLALQLVERQRLMLQMPTEPDIWPGRAASAANVLRCIAARVGAGAVEPAQIDAALDETLKARSEAPLNDIGRALSAALLAGGPVAAQDDGTGAALAVAADTPRRRWDDPPPGASRKATAIKVDQERIDSLMNLAGELIVAKNALSFLARRAEQVYGAAEMGKEIKGQYEVINRIADDLQTAVMQVRMVPVAHVFQRFTRLVRDLSRRLDKQIRLDVTGEDTEADKTVVEELADPLVHLLRNAIDHGLETPAERQDAGKPAEGVIRLSARQVDDRVLIEVADDGRGIDVEKVKRKALARGLLDEAQAAEISERDALQLIMEAGLSTAEQVSELSGRGVGMDVVRNMVRQTGGTIAIDSAPGAGTSVTISLPLSMAVHRIMMVDVVSETFGIPIDCIVETVRVPSGAIHRHKRNETIVLRDRLIPLCRLRQELEIVPDEGAVPGDGTAAGNGHRNGHGNGAGNGHGNVPGNGDGAGSAGRLGTGACGGQDDEESVLVVNVGGTEVGLVVDGVRSDVETIIKPLEGILATMRQYSGAALLGDGSVLLVLNVRELTGCR
jgi:two-component system chemotaxis sensor kinase CheA